MKFLTDQAPSFETESEERAYWENNDSGDYLDWSRVEKVRLPNLTLTSPPKQSEERGPL
jgi:hypothetical protein